jgi:hypothetical protein
LPSKAHLALLGEGTPRGKSLLGGELETFRLYVINQLTRWWGMGGGQQCVDNRITDKKEKKSFLIYKEIQRDLVQSHD